MSVYVSAAHAGRLLGRDPKHVKALAAEGRIGTFTPPGGRPRYDLADVERLATEATRPAKSIR